VPAVLLGVENPLLVPRDKKGSASGQASTRAGDDSRPSKADDPLRDRSLPGHAPGSAPSSGGLSGAAPSSAGGGFGLAAEFVLPLVAMLCCALGLSFVSPHSSALAFRSERPG
jgi:hypothetical protein